MNVSNRSQDVVVFEVATIVNLIDLVIFIRLGRVYQDCAVRVLSDLRAGVVVDSRDCLISDV